MAADFRSFCCCACCLVQIELSAGKLCLILSCLCQSDLALGFFEFINKAFISQQCITFSIAVIGYDTWTHCALSIILTNHNFYINFRWSSGCVLRNIRILSFIYRFFYDLINVCFFGMTLIIIYRSKSYISERIICYSLFSNDLAGFLIRIRG